MDQDRSLKDLIRFVDPSGSISDADIANISKNLKFTEVLDLITYVGKDQIDDARNILNKYDDRFSVAKEYSTVPAPTKPTGFKPVAPAGTKPTGAAAAGQQEEEPMDVNAMLADPKLKNKPEVRQIQSLLQRMQR